MTVWWYLSTIFNRRSILRIVGLVLLTIALITTLFVVRTSYAAPATTKTINFQGRLMSATGSVVPDGYYNIQFKIYQDGTGASAGNPGGTLKWTESYVNNSANEGVQVKNGYFSASLGSRNSFGTSVDWSQSNLFLSMNVAGNSASCTTFGSAPCLADGEMLPMKRITATPFALNSDAVGGKSADELVQLGQGTQTDTSNNSSIAINKTGTGNLIQLQASGTDAFTVNNAGSITLGSSTDQSITVATSATGAGKPLAISAGGAASGSDQAGGDLLLQGGAGDGTGAGGDVIVASNGTDTTGTFQVQNTAGKTIFNVDATRNTISAGTINLASGAGTGLGSPVSLWTNTTPTGGDYNDNEPVNLGMTFKSGVSGYVSGVKFYSAGGNASSADIGKLWACNNVNCTPAGGGSQLASVIFDVDTTEGWKTANFSSPVYITADTYYVVTYYTTLGKYKAASGGFDVAHSSSPLYAPSGFDKSNGSYTTSGANFPSASSGNTNYWIDVVFQAATNVDQISTNQDLIISSAGQMTVGPTSSNLKLQGSSIDITASSGGNITMQGGNATVGNGNGGSVTLSGGNGNGTGANGLVVLTTPTFSTTTSDANCFTASALVSSSCAITQTSVNNSSGIMVGFSTPGQTATLPNPTITTAGRVMYIMGAGGSSDFTLSDNGGATLLSLKQNATASLMWNGSTWTVVGGASSATLQDAYNAAPQTAGGSDIKLTDGTGGLTIRNTDTNAVKDSLLSVKNAGSSTILSVNGGDSATYASDGSVHDGVNFSTNWSAVGSATTTRTTLDGQEASDSAQVAAGTTAGNGIKNKLAVNPRINTAYRLSAYVKQTAGTPLTDFTMRYSPDNGATFVDCANYSTQTISGSEWTSITCDITTSDTAVTTPYIYFVQPTTAASARTYLVDSFVLSPLAGATQNVQVGNGTGVGTDTTLFTLDKSATAPTAASPDALLGSMYYDTALSKIQCYEAAGWGACGDRPDTFITISPEYSNAVTHGDGIGALTTDLCSDALNINDGSSSQPTVCGANETYNFYKWTSPELTNQTRSVFVTYQLPSTFKDFVPGTTSLMGRTNSSDANVSYQVYRNDRNASLTPCGSSIGVSTGSQAAWQKATANGSADPASCSFKAGDSIVLRINLDTAKDANAYISNLGFTFSNN